MPLTKTLSRDKGTFENSQFTYGRDWQFVDSFQLSSIYTTTIRMAFALVDV